MGSYLQRSLSAHVNGGGGGGGGCPDANTNRGKHPISAVRVSGGLPANETCEDKIDQIHQSNNAPVSYTTMHHFETEMWTFLFQSVALSDMGHVHCGICMRLVC